MQGQSEVEQLFAKLSALFGGTVQWNELHPQHQTEFVHALNILMQLCSFRKG